MLADGADDWDADLKRVGSLDAGLGGLGGWMAGFVRDDDAFKGRGWGEGEVYGVRSSNPLRTIEHQRDVHAILVKQSAGHVSICVIRGDL